MTYDPNPPGLLRDGELFRQAIDHALRGCDALNLATGMTAEEKRAQEQQKRGRGRPVACGRDARILVREKSGRRYLEAKWIGDRKAKCFPDTAEGWKAARAWRDSEPIDRG
jgi:hypothetical protein